MFLFDVLAKDEISLCHLSLEQRRTYLADIADGDLIDVAKSIDLKGGEGDDLVEQITSIAAQGLEAGVEGLIIKSLDAPYETSGKRVNTWLKLKNIALSSNMRDTLDLVPIAAFYGKGNRTGLYGSFLMASYN